MQGEPKAGSGGRRCPARLASCCARLMCVVEKGLRGGLRGGVADQLPAVPPVAITRPNDLWLPFVAKAFCDAGDRQRPAQRPVIFRQLF